MRLLIIIAGFLIPILNAYGNDSLMTLSFDEFFKVVKKFHPVAKQAAIQVSKANAELISARGGFDPAIESRVNSKTFDGLNYFQNSSLQLNIPTWYGIELRSGMEYLSGNRTDPAGTLGQTSFTGISIPLAKNLLMDKRRAVLQQAKIMVNASEQEMKIILNDLMKEAAESYWNWTQSYLVYKSYILVIELNKRRIEMVKSAFRIGEKAAIDTTEAISQLQAFEYLQNESLLTWKNATVELSNFLWKENNEVYDLTLDNITPNKKTEELFDAVIFPELEQLISSAMSAHPELLKYNYHLDVLSVDKKLKFQELLPELNVAYNQLGSGYNVVSTSVKPFFENNYRFGVNFSMPLRLSQGRGAYKIAKLKITETQLELDRKEIQVVNSIKAYYNRLVNYKLQLNLLQKTYANFLQLQKGEEIRFFNGESTLFLVNNRENKAQETLIKLTEAAINYNKTAVSLRWSAGELWKL